jgi:hypothetical protein
MKEEWQGWVRSMNERRMTMIGLLNERRKAVIGPFMNEGMDDRDRSHF